MEAPLNDHQSLASPKPSSKSCNPSSKRVRIVVSQSKRGCVTCRARRVKCDEQKPLCQRCVQAGRLCGGYIASSSALQPALRTGIIADSHTERLSYLTFHVLSLDNDGRPLQDDVWGCIFLQLSNQVECVKAAAVAFGAAYEASLNNTIVKGPRSAWGYYGSALAKLRSGFDNKTVGPESLALASMVLASVEILNQHEQNAFAHFLGAVQILTKTYERRQGAPSTNILGKIIDALVNINILIGGYGLSQTPQTMYLEFQEVAVGDDPFCEPDVAINASMLCLHRSYQFIQAAAQLRYKYLSWREYDPIMHKAQSDTLTQCRSILDGLAVLATRLQGQYSPATSTLRDSEILAEIYAIRTQVTLTLIVIMCVHNPFETGYDEHQDLFQSIVSDAAASARLRRRTKISAFKQFSTRPGIVSPLFMVSLKCRHPPLRALATTMLKEQSREGPADGHILAAIAARVAALEKTTTSASSSSGAPLAARDIFEEQRIYGYSVLPPRIIGEGRRIVDVIFSWPNPPLVQGWGHVDYTCRDGWFYQTESIDI